jgi:hypothetical protein
MFKSPLVLPLTLIFAGVLAFMATTGVLPATVLRFWPIVFVILGLVGLVSLSTDEIMPSQSAKKTTKPATKVAAKKSAPAKKKSASKKK